MSNAIDQPPQLGADDVKQLAQAKFTYLSAAEKLLLEKVSSGEMADCSKLDNRGNDPRRAAHWSTARTIRAELLVWLCGNEQARKYVHWRGLQVDGAAIVGALDLSFISMPFQLTLNNSYLGKQVDLSRTELSELDLSGSVVNGIDADTVRVTNYVFLRNATVNGRTSFLNARIGGNFECDSATFANPEGVALEAGGSDIKGFVFLRNGFAADGLVGLSGAQIGGDLNCIRGTFNQTLDLVGIKVKGDVYLGGGFTARGEVDLNGAQVEGQLNCSGGVFSNPDGTALDTYRAIVKSSIFLRDGFVADGKVYLEGVQIGGTLECWDGNFEKAILDLRDASAGTFYDSGLNDIPAGDPHDFLPTKWPQPGNLFLDGFRYGRVSSKGQLNVGKRLDWLGRQPLLPFPARSYLQLAKVLQESGEEEGALHVKEQMEQLRRRSAEHGLIASLESFVLRTSIGYGYFPARAIWGILGLSLLGWIIYRRSYFAGGIVPTDKDACAEFKGLPLKAGGEDGIPDSQRAAARVPHIPRYYPGFSPLIYSVENSLPLVKLGQADKWQPDPERDRHQALSWLAQRLGSRGRWRSLGQKPQAEAGGRDTVATDNPPAPSPLSTSSTPEGSAISGYSGTTVTTAAIEPESQVDPQEPMPAKHAASLARIAATLNSSLIAVGLQPTKASTSTPSFARRVATSPQFVRWFLWIQILLGWLLATLFLAGVSGIVHKD